MNMNEALDDVQESLLEGEQHVVRRARKFYEDFTCTAFLLLGH